MLFFTLIKFFIKNYVYVSIICIAFLDNMYIFVAIFNDLLWTGLSTD